MISIDLGSKVKDTRADSFSAVSGLKLKGFSSWIDDTLHLMSMSDNLYRFRGHKVKVTRADSLTVSGLKLKGFSSWIDDTSHV